MSNVDFDGFLKRLAARHKAKEAEFKARFYLVPAWTTALILTAMTENFMQLSKTYPANQVPDKTFINLLLDNAILIGLALVEMESQNQPGRKPSLYMVPGQDLGPGSRN